MENNLRQRPNPSAQPSAANPPGDSPVGGNWQGGHSPPVNPAGQPVQAARPPLVWGHVGINTWGPLLRPVAPRGVVRETFSDNFLLPKPGPDLGALGLPAW